MAAVKQNMHVLSYLGDLNLAAGVLLNRVVLAQLNVALAAGGLAQATNTTGVKTVNTVQYKTDGIFRTALTAQDNFWTLTGGVLAASRFRKYFCCVDSAGVASVVSSTDAATSAACVYPTMPDGVAIFGHILVATDATHTFTPGTTSLTATGITTTFFDGPGAPATPVLADDISGNTIVAAGLGAGSYLG